MLENLRRKSLVKTYIDPIYSINFDQGHASYLDSLSIGQHKQKLSKQKIEKPFQRTINFINTSFKISCTLANVKANMIFCPSGTFTMGHNWDEDDKPKKKKIERPFLLGETEITQELYEKVMNNNPSKFKNDSQNPVEMVSWLDVILFCNELSRLQGLDLCYTKNPKSLDNGWDCDFNKNGYRLPEEKEWEYAAKAGTENKWAGTDNEDELVDYAWFGENSSVSTHPVKTKKPNAWGFYDMSGNVWEWCWDKYNPRSKDYSGCRVVRGGGWSSRHTEDLRSAFRLYYSPGNRFGHLGFRVCRSI